MIFLFLWIFEYNILVKCDPVRQEFDDSLWAKLKIYQNKTAISDESMTKILQKIIDTKAGSVQGFWSSVIVK